MATSLKSLRKRKVVDTATAETIGRVRGVRIDPSGPSVIALEVKGAVSGVVAFSEIIGIGPDAVTLPRAATVIEQDVDAPTDADAYGARLLDDGGREHGTVSDLVIDDDGRVIQVVAGDQTFDRTLLGIGSYAVVISRA
ncbi:hypothetical protein [Euzebya sp.]|uniref:hypothetical protein n=1 Tax=Euzebya sp. TaxID=1971409 RepID=UPI00351676C0